MNRPISIKFINYNYYYFSFGFGMEAVNGQDLKNCYTCVKALSEEKARLIMYNNWGNVAQYLSVYKNRHSLINMVQIRNDYNSLYLTK